MLSTALLKAAWLMWPYLFSHSDGGG